MATKTSILKNKILVVNCGSSSIKFQVIDPVTKCLSINGIAERLNTPKAVIKLKEINKPKTTIAIDKKNDHKSVFDRIFQDIISDQSGIIGVGHRVVHGGDYFKVRSKIQYYFTYRSVMTVVEFHAVKDEIQ